MKSKSVAFSATIQITVVNFNRSSFNLISIFEKKNNFMNKFFLCCVSFFCLFNLSSQSDLQNKKNNDAFIDKIHNRQSCASLTKNEKALNRRKQWPYFYGPLWSSYGADISAFRSFHYILENATTENNLVDLGFGIGANVLYGKGRVNFVISGEFNLGKNSMLSRGAIGARAHFLKYKPSLTIGTGIYLKNWETDIYVYTSYDAEIAGYQPLTDWLDLRGSLTIAYIAPNIDFNPIRNVLFFPKVGLYFHSFYY